MGPTPPGTGVMAFTFSFTSSKWTSPTSLPLILLIPTSITIDPSFIQLPLTKFGTPAAATKI